MSILSSAESFALGFCLAGDLPDDRDYLDILLGLEHDDNIEYGPWEVFEDLPFDQLRDIIDDLKEKAQQHFGLLNQMESRKDKTVVMTVQDGAACYYYCPDHINLHIVDYDLLGEEVGEKLVQDLTNFQSIATELTN